MHSRTPSRTLVASILFTLSLAPTLDALPAAGSAPTLRPNSRSECRCLTITDPSASSLFLIEASKSRHWRCAELGPKLEYWRKTNPDEFEATWKDLIVDEEDSASLVSKTVPQELGPLPTTVLMELASRQQEGLQSPGERIICRAREETLGQPNEKDDGWTDHGLGIMTFFIVLVVLGCVAELLDMLLSKINIFHWRYRQPIFLSGSEKTLLASDPNALEGERVDDYQRADERPVL